MGWGRALRADLPISSLDFFLLQSPSRGMASEEYLPGQACDKLIKPDYIVKIGKTEIF